MAGARDDDHMAFLEDHRAKLGAIQAAAACAEEQAELLAGVRKRMDGIERMTREPTSVSEAGYSTQKEYGGMSSSSYQGDEGLEYSAPPQFRPTWDVYDEKYDRPKESEWSKSAWDMAALSDCEAHAG